MDKVKAKDLSKIFKILCTLGLIITAFIKWRGLLPAVNIQEICTMWATVYGIGAGTIDLNILAEKFAQGEKNV